jgi:RHS repeat-associated protein
VDTITTSGQGFFSQEFDVFGAPVDPPSPEVTRRGFTGHQHDQDLGLIDMKGRIYDPLAGRFTSADPIIQAPFSTQGLNRYSYAFNNPVNYVDPSGFDVDWSDSRAQFSGALMGWAGGVGALAYGSFLGQGGRIASGGAAAVGSSGAGGGAAAMRSVVGPATTMAGLAYRGITGSWGGARPGSSMSVTGVKAATTGSGVNSMDAASQNKGDIVPQRGGASQQAKEPAGDWAPESKPRFPGEPCMAEDCHLVFPVLPNFGGTEVGDRLLVLVTSRLGAP